LSSSKPLADQSHCDYELAELGDRLRELRKEVLDGRGFTLIRGLSTTGWTDAELTRAYWIIGSVFGNPVSQNARADLLGHVTDLTGGESAIASSATIHNQLLEKKPEALQTLYGEFMCDRYGEVPDGKAPFYPVHVFNSVDGRLVCCGMDPDIRLAPRLDGVDELSESQVSALDAFQQTAKETALAMTLERGDIQLVNNLTVVHAREFFEDHTELDRRRYLLRLWLSSPVGRKLPEFLSERWGNISVGSHRGGIKVAGVQPQVNFDP